MGFPGIRAQERRWRSIEDEHHTQVRKPIRYHLTASALCPWALIALTPAATVAEHPQLGGHVLHFVIGKLFNVTHGCSARP